LRARTPARPTRAISVPAAPNAAHRHHRRLKRNSRRLPPPHDGPRPSADPRGGAPAPLGLRAEGRPRLCLPAQLRPAGPPACLGLSPYIRHRLVTEEEVLRAILGRHSLAAAEKAVQESSGEPTGRAGSNSAPRSGPTTAAGSRRRSTGCTPNPVSAATGKPPAAARPGSTPSTTGRANSRHRLSPQPRPHVVRLDLDLHAAPALGARRGLLPPPPPRRRPGLQYPVLALGRGAPDPGQALPRPLRQHRRYTEGRFRPTGLSTSPPARSAAPRTHRALPRPRATGPTPPAAPASS
jgi:hypothetical protein